MKILFIARATLYTAFGGDSVQVIRTAEYLRKLGVEVRIHLAHETIDYSPYDLVHFFNIIRPADILGHLKQSGLPAVISPVFVDYREYDRYHRKGLLGTLSRLLPADTIEYLKALARMVKNGEKINSYQYLLKGHRRSVQYLIRQAKCLLPNSESEYQRLFNTYKTSQHYAVVPYAVDTNTFAYTPQEKEQREGVICMAQIEGRKNQLNLIRAINDTDLKLKIIGKPTPNSQGYYEQCQKEAGSNIEFVGYVPQEQLPDYYRQAKVHVLASWFETAGLSSLEAATMGCSIVISDKGDTRDYFKDFARYCDPASPQSIREQVVAAYHAPADTSFKEYIAEHYTWEKTAAYTLEAYETVLK